MLQIDFLAENMAIAFTTILFFLIFVISNYSIIGYGLLLKNIYLKSKDKENSTNFLVSFIIGLIILNMIGFLTYFFSINSKNFNLIIIILGFIVYLKNEKFEIVKTKGVFFLFLIFYIGLLISKTHEDYIPYHFKYIDIITNYNLILGLGNLEINYVYTSFFSYVQKIYNFPFFNNKLLHIPQFLIYFNLIFFLVYEILKRKSFYISFLVLFLFLVIKFTRLSEFGYDYPAGFIILIMMIIFLDNLHKKQLVDIWLLITIYFYAITIKITSLFFLPVILTIFLFLIIKKNNEFIIQKKIYYKILFLIILISIFAIDNLIRYGCVTYLIKFSCLDTELFPWTINFEDIDSFRNHVELWAKGYYHQNTLTQFSKETYLNSYNWIGNWVKEHFFYKVFEFILLLIILSIIVLFKLNKYLDINYKFKNFHICLLASITIALITWFFYLPQLRFGFYIFICLIILIIEFLNKNKTNRSKFYNTLIILALVFYIAKNIIRIQNEFERDDRYKFVNFPFENRTKYVEDYNFIVEQNKWFSNLDTIWNIRYIKRK